MSEVVKDTVKHAFNQATDKVHDVVSSNAKVQDLWKDVDDVGASTNAGNGQTTDFGSKVGDVDHWLKIVDPETGRAGPSLLEDHIARERIHRFDHERIPERVVHARGTAAHGVFKLTKAIPHLTCAGILTDTSRTTPTFVRFSTVLGSRGSADTVRDVRGFATKFYTPEGNWDIVGNNIPVFFIQDAMKFPDVIHAGKPEPHNEVPQAQSAHNNFWDFQYLHPEATHMFTWAMSDRAIPRSYRMMQGFGVNTYTLINEKGERTFVKFHWIPELGVHSLVWDEALKLAGQDPDFHRKDLYEAINSGAYPKWFFGIQTIPESKEHDFDFDILDATKVWPEDLVPVEIIGEMELNRCPEEFFTEVEQVAYCTSHVVPGIGFSDDPLLQGRNFSYLDTQLTRLGVNWQELPINRPVCPVMNFNRDGAMKHRIHKGTVNYWPNRLEAAPPHPVSNGAGAYIDAQQRIAGMKIRTMGAKFKEHYSQAQLFYNSMAPHEKMHIQNALAFELDHCDDPLVYERMVQRLGDIDLNLAKTVADMVGGEPPKETSHPNHGKKAKGLSQTEFPPSKPTIKSRRVAIIVADGFDLASYEMVHKAIKAASAVPFLIAPRRAKVFPAGHEPGKDRGIMADHHFEGMRSTMFDAVFIPSGAQHALTLAKNGRAIHYVREAFGHLKAIGAVGDGVDFLQKAVMLPGVNLALDPKSSEVVDSYGVVTQWGFTEEDTTIGSLAASTTKFLPTFAFEIAQHRNYQREMDGLIKQLAF